MSAEKKISVAVFSAGFTALAAQIVFLRGFFVFFRGHELAFGFILACWLGWTAWGSLLAGRWKTSLNPENSWLIWHHIQAALLPLTFLLIAANRCLSRALPGEALSMETAMLFALLETAPFCFVSGMLYSIGSRWKETTQFQDTGTATSRIYLLETIGSAAAGILVSLFLLLYIDDLYLAITLTILNYLILLFLCAGHGRRRIIIVLMVQLFLSVVLVYSPSIKLNLIQKGWQPFDVAYRLNSKFGEWLALRLEEGFAVYQNGIQVFTYPDPATAEENVHPALLQHRKPQTVLLIGGGFAGGIEQALKHPSLRKLVYVEPDPAVFQLLRHLDIPLSSDSRVEYVFEDARYYLLHNQRRFDVIICNTPEPVNAQLNRFYTSEFFQLIKSRLNENGLLALQAVGSENFINPDHARYLSSIDQTIKSVFNHVGYLPGEPIHFFAADEKDITRISADTLINQMKKRQLNTRYIREYYLPFRLMPDRMATLSKALQTDNPEINHDYLPRTYYLNNIFLGSRFFSPSALLLKFISPLWLILTIFLLLPIFWYRIHYSSRRPNVYFWGAAFTTGAAVMTGALVIMVLFQSLFGYVYYELALLNAGVMAGMALGVRNLPSLCKTMTSGFILLSAVLIGMLLLAANPVIHFLLGFDRTTGSLLFLALIFLCGYAGGRIYQMASQSYFAEIPDGNAGVIYSADLLGAIAGAFFSSAILIPVMGIPVTLVVIIIPIILLLLSWWIKPL